MSKRRSRPPLADAVTVAYVHSDECSMSWHHSIVEMVAHDLAHHQRLIRGGWVAMHCGTGGLVEARNDAVKTFLEDKAAPWLLWTDTDMGFEPDALDRLMAVAHPEAAPVVGGLCFSQRELEQDRMHGYHTAATPTIFDWSEIDGQQGFAVRFDYLRGQVQRCAGTGSAFVLVHRSAFERVQAKHGPNWYTRIPNVTTGQLVSEDLCFCMRLLALDIPIHVHAGVEASHHKGIWISEEVYMRQRIAEAVVAKRQEAQQESNGHGPEGAKARALAKIR